MIQGKDEDVIGFLATAIGAGCALIGLLAFPNNSDDTPVEIVKNSWVYGDLMCAEFMRRVKVIQDAEDAKKSGGK